MMPSIAEQEVSFDRDELIITKTDLQGKITYANRTFMRVANYAELELLGQNHNIIRHPSMPRGVFYGLWDTLQSGKEFFGFVKNCTSNGNYYWVFANITPDLINGRKVGFYSVRRFAPIGARKEIEAIYQQMLDKERASDRHSAPESSWKWMVDLVKQEHNMGYEEYVLSLYHEHS